MALAMALALPALAAGNDKSYTGTITAVDAKDNTVKVRAYLLTREFIMADDCAFTLGAKTRASLADFRPGQRVDIHYKDVGGIRVAERMTEEQMQYSGTVHAVDLTKHTLTVHRRGMNKTFDMANNCLVTTHGKNGGTMEDVKIGDRVTVVYEVPQDKLMARKIELPDAVYTGSLAAINADDRTISAGKKYLGDRKFRLADNCVIFSNGKPNGRMSDLQLGRQYELNYQSVGGINIVDRIAPVEATMKSETSVPTAQTTVSEQ